LSSRERQGIALAVAGMHRESLLAKAQGTEGQMILTNCPGQDSTSCVALFCIVCRFGGEECGSVDSLHRRAGYIPYQTALLGLTVWKIEV